MAISSSYLRHFSCLKPNVSYQQNHSKGGKKGTPFVVRVHSQFMCRRNLKIFFWWMAYWIFLMKLEWGIAIFGASRKSVNEANALDYKRERGRRGGGVKRQTTSQYWNAIAVISWKNSTRQTKIYVWASACFIKTSEATQNCWNLPIDSMKQKKLQTKKKKNKKASVSNFIHHSSCLHIQNNVTQDTNTKLQIYRHLVMYRCATNRWMFAERNKDSLRRVHLGGKQ